MDVATGTPSQVFAIGMWFRVVCAAVFLVLLVACQAAGLSFSSGDLRVTYVCLALLVLLNGVYWAIGLGSGFDLRQFYGHWAMDLALISGAVWGLGNAGIVGAIPAFALIIVTSATFISQVAAFAVASGAAIAFVLLVRTGSLTFAGGRVTAADAASSELFLAGNGVFFFYLFAFLAGTLATALSKANSQLRLQNDELAGKNRALDELQREMEFQTTALTHDIRGPVAAAASAIGLLRSAGDVEKGDDLLTMALENLERADAMIDDLREVRLVNAAQLLRGNVDLGELCMGLKKELEVELEAGRIRLRIPPANAEVVGDEKGLRMVLRNLLSNAVRYVPRDGSGIISVRTSERANGWEIEVADNGPGIPTEYRTEVFKSFRKLPGDTASRGMGLGLSIAKRVIERHGGTISLGSSAFGGAAFECSCHVRFSPVADADAA